MRICVLSEYFYPDNTGGTGTVLSKLVRHLKDHYENLEIDVITSKNLFRDQDSPLPREENWQGVRILRLSTPPPHKNSVRRRLAANLMFTQAALVQLVNSHRKYDLLLVVTAPPTLPLAARVFSRLTGTPYAYLVYDLYLDMAIAMKMVPPQSQMVKRMKKIQRNWLHAASKVIVLGRCMREHVINGYEVPPERVEIVSIPSDCELIYPMNKATRFRARNTLSGFIVLYAGNLARYQDFDTLLDAAKLLGAESGVTFVFVGDGAKRGYIDRRVEEEQLTNVRMFPFVPEQELCDLLASADVSLVTLERGMEGLAVPSKFYNILASGRPTIMVGDPKSEVARVILETECGFQVEQGDSARLAALLRELAATPAKLDQLSENAHRVCLQEYSMEKIGKQFYTALTAAALPIHRTRRTTSRSRRRTKGETQGSAEVGISEN